MLVRTLGCAISGLKTTPVSAEVATYGGLREVVIVGLPDSAVKESKERVEAAIVESGFDFPKGRTVINLAPADIRKEGSSYDLTIALGILGASGQVKSAPLETSLIMGELSLDGSLKPIRGALPIAIEARRLGLERFLLPAVNAPEAAIVDKIDVIPIQNLRQAVDFLNGRREIEPLVVQTRELFAYELDNLDNDFSDVRGQENVKRALEVAAAGGHNVLMVGPPGAGKSMLAKRMPGILPPLTLQEALETTKIYSVAGKLGQASGLVARRPFRAPHHTISDVALVGGGTNALPGEISLAHNGILFLDELPEFKRQVLEVMRQPLEERTITISRARFTVEYPAALMLVASMNPCPCGYYNHPTKPCVCAPAQIHKYLTRISGPLLDRIDLHVEVTPVDFDELSQRVNRTTETSSDIRIRVDEARQRQLHRYKDNAGVYGNAMMPQSAVEAYCQLDKPSELLLKTAMQRLSLSARAYSRILKVARTIADLADRPTIQAEHIAEAIQYRNLDRETWGQ